MTKKIKRIDMQEQLKTFLHENLVKRRKQLGLTQEEMADILVMDTRSYIELDHGNNMCGTLTLVLFMLYCCQDPMILLNEIQDMFEDAESNVS